MVDLERARFRDGVVGVVGAAAAADGKARRLKVAIRKSGREPPPVLKLNVVEIGAGMALFFLGDDDGEPVVAA